MTLGMKISSFVGWSHAEFAPNSPPTPDLKLNEARGAR